MSRTFIVTSCRFFLGLLASATVIAGGLDVQQTHAQALISAPVTSVEMDPEERLLLTLLDDVTINNHSDSDDYYSIAAKCQLNAPVDLDPEVVNEPPPSSEPEDDWLDLLTFTCDDEACSDCSSLTFANSPPCSSIKSCSWESESTSEYPEGYSDFIVQPAHTKSETYSDQVAELLATTLHSSQASFEAKSDAIKSAMNMVVEKTLADAEAEIAELKATHQKEIYQLQGKIVSAKDQTESYAQIMSWLRPIYTNQNRNYRQLQLLSANRDEKPESDLPKLETSNYKKANPINNRHLLPSNAQVASKLLADYREAEIAKLKKELEIIDARLSRLVVKPLQRASHLEPVYVPKQQLVPIHDLPQRYSRLNGLEPIQKDRKVRR